jgi:MoxR-like ATPase
MDTNTAVESAGQQAKLLQEQLNQIILGKTAFIEQLLTGFFAGGHILIEDVPGLGKTTTAKALGKLILQAKVSRIQCTPDLLPYDITGVEFYDAKNNQFRFEMGPIFADIVLADELNRANPRTQSALLEAMAESQVTVSNQTHRLSDTFFVIATQNPMDAESSYHLPSAELDRFMFKLSVGYPDFTHEALILESSIQANTASTPSQLLSLDEVRSIRQAVKQVHCSTGIIHFVTAIVQGCREHPSILLGPSPRAAIHLLMAAKSLALLRGRSFVIDQDILELLPITLVHRMKAHQSESNLASLLEQLYKQHWSGVLRS